MRRVLIRVALLTVRELARAVEPGMSCIDLSHCSMRKEWPVHGDAGEL